MFLLLSGQPKPQSCWQIKLTITFPYTFIGTFKIIIYLHCLFFQLLRLCKKLSQDMWFKTIATYSLFMNLQLGQMLARRAPLNSTLVSAVMLRLFKSLLTLMSGWQWVSRWDNEHEQLDMVSLGGLSLLTARGLGSKTKHLETQRTEEKRGEREALPSVQFSSVTQSCLTHMPSLRSHTASLLAHSTFCSLEWDLMWEI